MKNRAPFLVWLLLSTIWGSTWLFIKVGLADLPPFTFAGIRFLVAVVPIVIYLMLTRTPLPREPRNWTLMVGTGFLTFALNYGLVFWGEQQISSGLTAILYTTMPLFGLLLAHWRIPEEPLTARRLIGVLAGIVGVGLIFSRQLQFAGPLVLWGSAAIVLAALGTALANVAIKLRAHHISAPLLTAIQMISGLIPLLIVGLATEGSPLDFHWTPMAWISLFYLALVGSSLAFVLLYWLMKRMPVTRTQLIPILSTLLAVLLGWAFLGETLSWRTAAGGAAILIGLWLASRRQGRTEAQQISDKVEVSVESSAGR
jgi:drug/metabolite transporter (DMT)-like permease